MLARKAQRVHSARFMVLGLGCALPFLVPGCAHREKLPPHPRPLPKIEDRGRPATARRIIKPADLLQGQLATARLGDFLIDNQVVRLLIAGLDRPGGGALIDAGLSSAGKDSLRSLTPVAGVDAMKAPVYRRLEIEEIGGTATVRLLGRDAAHPDVEVRTEYTLHPGASAIRLTTTVKNRGKKPLLQYKIGDRIDWGRSIPFAPGVGISPQGTPALLWMAAWSAEASYGYFGRGDAMAGNLADLISTVTVQTLELPPGEQLSVQRLLAVGEGGQIAGLLPGILHHQGTSSGRVRVTVYSEVGLPIPGARVVVKMEGKQFTNGSAGSDGQVDLTLPPGVFQISAVTEDRISLVQTVDVRPDRTVPLRLSMGPPSRLVFDLREEGSESSFPVKLTIFGLDGTQTPWLGPVFSASAVNTHLSPTGKGILPLPPGRYRIIASHGPEYSIHSEIVDLKPHGGASLAARLRREVVTQGYLGVDLGQQTFLSPGCGVNPADRNLSNLAEGVDALVSAEIDRMPSAAWSKAADPRLLRLVGISHRSTSAGMFSAFPLPDDLDHTALDALLDRSSSETGPLLQLEKGRRPGGLFNLVNYDSTKPDVSLIPGAFTMMRVLDGNHPEDFDQLLEDWFSLLRSGRRITATGASASRSVFGEEAGYPRTYVAMPQILSPELTFDKLLSSLRGGRAIVSSGPFMLVTVNGQGPGATVSLKPPRGRRARRRGKVTHEVLVEVTVAASSWIGLDTLTLYVDGQPEGDPDPIPGRQAGVRLTKTYKVKVDKDCFLVALARGNGTLSPVVSGLGPPLPPIALSNPIWIDVDGNGKYDP